MIDSAEYTEKTPYGEKLLEYHDGEAAYMLKYAGYSETEAREYTDTYLSQFLDEMYVKKYCNEEMREDILGLMRDIVEEYREMLREETWLTEEARDKAIKKLDAMTLGAAYPTSREDWSGFNFRSRAEGGNYMEANAELWRCQVELKRKKSFGKPDPGIWQWKSSSINGNYIPASNSICICAGMLNGDMYRNDMTREELLAGAGTFIAHEISHAFDSFGAQFDENGALENWWTDADKAAFESRIDKVIAYYDSMHPWKDGSSYSGHIVQEEATADLGSMACILRLAEKTKGFDYDAFFRAYAHRWRMKISPAALEKSFSTNPHPLYHLRVNALIAQFPKFQETYDIQPGDGMYVAPEDRVIVWGMPDNNGQ